MESNQVNVNGLNALTILADVKPEQEQQASTVRILSYLIQYNNTIYLLLGASSVNDFNSYSSYFSQTMKNFKELKEVSKLNKQPERIRIKSVSTTGSLSQAFSYYKIAENRFEEMAILNGMQLTDKVQKGSLIKIISN